MKDPMRRETPAVRSKSDNATSHGGEGVRLMGQPRKRVELPGIGSVELGKLRLEFGFAAEMRAKRHPRLIEPFSKFPREWVSLTA